MDSQDNNVRQFVDEIAALMTAFSAALENSGVVIQASGKDTELADKLARGAGIMRDSRDIYLSWARHYGALLESNPEARVLARLAGRV